MDRKRVAVLTEAGNGLGKAMANLLLHQNYKVIIAAGEESYNKLSQEGNSVRDFDLILVDFTSEHSLLHLRDKIKKEYGQLDLLINNAETVNGFGHKIDQLDISEVKYLFEINFFSILRIVQLMKPLLENSEAPKIINVTSALGDLSKMNDETFCYSNYDLTGYSCAKAALNMYTHLQCKEFKPDKINIYSFDPVALKNCTYNSVIICDEVKDRFISLVQ